MTVPPRPVEPTLREILGGRHGAIDATAPVAAFVVGWLLADRLGSPSAVAWGGGAAVVAAILVAGFRMVRGGRPRSVLLGLLPVAVAVGVAVATGRAVDFFLVQIVSNAGSALAFAVSIVIRWPLLGVIVGLVLGQRTRWRRDPDLLRGYGRASWVWAGQYLVRLVVFLPLFAAGQVVALGIARIALTWPLVAACVGLSWVVLRRSLPEGHPGLLHPVVDGSPTESPTRPNDHGES
ncbi:DUF3159 domain-containing protein [Pseudonocardia sp. N23]|uniref:DUF3159 domain-containing protein n=1 Tax=Pseudonocardia sp. N23 TaxID=1987376 RepID=UPI000C02FBEF|nr:DUF3159 domain-containing protein [Pseudonocardia sp. N23]GAY09073.1 probable conserved integral membrane alanine and leucine rich protein [Pseudonocardia sp. N23]